MSTRSMHVMVAWVIAVRVVCAQERALCIPVSSGSDGRLKYVSAEECQVEIRTTLFADSRAADNGGAVSCDGAHLSLRLADDKFRQCEVGQYWYGGAVYAVVASLTSQVGEYVRCVGYNGQALYLDLQSAVADFSTHDDVFVSNGRAEQTQSGTIYATSTGAVDRVLDVGKVNITATQVALWGSAVTAYKTGVLIDHDIIASTIGFSTVSIETAAAYRVEIDGVVFQGNRAVAGILFGTGAGGWPVARCTFLRNTGPVLFKTFEGGGPFQLLNCVGDGDVSGNAVGEFALPQTPPAATKRPSPLSVTLIAVICVGVLVLIVGIIIVAVVVANRRRGGPRIMAQPLAE